MNAHTIYLGTYIANLKPMNVADIQWNTARPYERQAHFAPDRMAGSVPVWGARQDDNQAESSIVSASLSLAGEINKPMIAPTVSFDEFIDIINPLHHIPVVNGVYRSMSGDDLSSVARIVGGSLYGGPIGGVVSLINAAVEEHSGQDLSSALWENASLNKKNEIEVALSSPRHAYRFND